VAVLHEDIAHGLVNRPFGVEDDSVEVEKKGGRFHAREVAVMREIAMLKRRLL